jgi:ATP-binding cassette, subfamily C (CFTR/MRP), member 1
MAVGGTRTAKSLHERALQRVFRTPTTFFDINPMGRIINRFSRDQDTIDNTLVDTSRLFTLTFATSLATFALVAYVTTGYFLVGLVPMMIVYYYCQHMYRCSSRELKRLDSITRSPIYAHFFESLVGYATIRAYGEQKR